MHPHPLQSWVGRRIAVRTRLEQVCLSYLLVLMVVTRKHSLAEASRFAGLPKSQFSKLLQYHTQVALSTLEELSTKQAKPFAKIRQSLQGLPWKMALVIDSTLQHRASLYPENAKQFNHGNGFVIGHQGTHIVLISNDLLIPLQPIPFYSKR